jgi:hypothetical protein
MTRALEHSVDRDLGDSEDLRRLGGAKRQYVAEHEHRPLARREALQGRYEREPDRFADLIPSRGLLPAVGYPVQQDVGIRLQPHRLSRPGRLGRRRGLLWRRRQLREPPPASTQVGQGLERGLIAGLRASQQLGVVAHAPACAMAWRRASPA